MKIRPINGSFNLGATTQGYNNTEVNQNSTTATKLQDDAAAVRLAASPKVDAQQDRASRVAELATKVRDGEYKPASGDVATALFRDLL